MKKVTLVDSVSGQAYSYVEEDEEWLPEDGDWRQPFPNEKGNSTAFGLAEAFLQSDERPPTMDVVDRVIVETVDNFMESFGDDGDDD